jgi:beta-galactosidase
VAEAGVAPAAVPPAGVEVVRRRSTEGRWLFVLNHTDEHREVDVVGHDLVSGVRVGPTLRLAPRTAAVVREE